MRACEIPTSIAPLQKTRSLQTCVHKLCLWLPDEAKARTTSIAPFHVNPLGGHPTSPGDSSYLRYSEGKGRLNFYGVHSRKTDAQRAWLTQG